MRVVFGFYCGFIGVMVLMIIVRCMALVVHKNDAMAITAFPDKCSDWAASGGCTRITNSASGCTNFERVTDKLLKNVYKGPIETTDATLRKCFLEKDGVLRNEKKQ